MTAIATTGPGAAAASRIRAVLFDVDGTLYHQPSLRAFMAAEIAAAALVPGAARRVARAARILRAYRVAHEELRANRVESPRLGALQLGEAARRLGVPQHEVADVVSEWMCRRPLKYLPFCRRRDMLATVRLLSAWGLRVGVLSDYPAQAKLAALDAGDLFSLVLCTSDPEIGALKPSPRGFWRACESWNLAPEEVLYVGDRFEVDGQGASAAGLRSAVLAHDGHRRAAGLDAIVSLRRLGDIGRLVRA